MKILLTSARMPHALDQIRKFGRQGHDVYATDTFKTSPGIRSRYVKQYKITAAPTFASETFLSEIEDFMRTHHIELLIPGFEDALHLMKSFPDGVGGGSIFSSPFEVLSMLHNKHSFHTLAQSLGLLCPETKQVTSQDELKNVITECAEYFVRPVYSRVGGVIVTNTGPLAGWMRVEECSPTAAQPWIVQPFIEGKDICSSSIAHHGKIVSHCAYEHPKTINHAGGIAFESVDEPETLAIAQACVKALNYHGQIGFDFRKTPQGLVLIECNPRPTIGVSMMTDQMFTDAVLNPRDKVSIVKPGVRKQIGIALLRDSFYDWRATPDNIKRLFSGVEDIYVDWDDKWPGLYQLLSYSQVLSFRRQTKQEKRKRTDLSNAMAFDISWNGEK